MTNSPAANPEDNNGLRRLRARLAPLWFCLLAPLAISEPAAECAVDQPTKRLVLIIDDMGNQLRRGQQALALPGRITYAFIPYTPFGQRLAISADAAGKEVMLHAPMSNLQDLPMERGALTAELSKADFRATLEAALAEIPQAKGVNNHMGSDLTQRRRQMAWLMQELRSRDMYFVDSRTSDKTIAATVAGEFSVPHLSRQVFLDNERSLEAIAASFDALLGRLEQEPVAVGIGHPYPETLAFLEQALPQLAARDIELAFVSDVLRQPTPHAVADVPQKPDYSLTSTPCSAI